MASWEFSSIGIECEKEKENLVLQFMDCLEYSQVTGDGFKELDSRAGSMSFYARENDGLLWFYGGNSIFSQDINPIDNRNYYGKNGLTELYYLLSYTFGEITLYYQYEIGDNTSDGYCRIEEKYLPSDKIEVNVCNYCIGTNEVFGEKAPSNKLKKGMTLAEIGKKRYVIDTPLAAYNRLAELFDIIVNKASTNSYTKLIESIPDMNHFTIPMCFKKIRGFEFSKADFVSVIIPKHVKKISSGEMEYGHYGYHPAFSSCDKLESVTIDSKVIMEKNAFSYCGNLKVINISQINEKEIYRLALAFNLLNLAEYKITNEKIKCITVDDGVLFDKNKTTLISCPSGKDSCTIPESVKTIGYFAFRNCKITTISIPDSVTEIGWGAFDGCTGLTTITIPDSVTIIGEPAFSGCKNLSEIILGPNSNFVISDGALWTKDMQTKIFELAQ